MTLLTAGATTHYTIEYDDTLSSVDGLTRANGLLGVCENDFALMSGWFGGIALTVATPITVEIVPGGYARAGWGPPITLQPGNGSHLDVVRYLLVSEVTEMFMLAQARGWFGAGNEGSAGEGLSRFLAGQFLIANNIGVTEPGFALANSWMTSTRDDFVNHVDVTDHAIDPKTGCAILFIYWLHVQLGYSIEAIIAAGASELSGVYRNLTGDTADPFPRFKALLDCAYPGTTAIPGPNPDNPYPIPATKGWVNGWGELYTGNDRLVMLDVAKNADGRLEVFGDWPGRAHLAHLADGAERRLGGRLGRALQPQRPAHVAAGRGQRDGRLEVVRHRPGRPHLAHLADHAQRRLDRRLGRALYRRATAWRRSTSRAMPTAASRSSACDRAISGTPGRPPRTAAGWAAGRSSTRPTTPCSRCGSPKRRRPPGGVRRERPGEHLAHLADGAQQRLGR